MAAGSVSPALLHNKHVHAEPVAIGAVSSKGGSKTMRTGVPYNPMHRRTWSKTQNATCSKCRRKAETKQIIQGGLAWHGWFCDYCVGVMTRGLSNVIVK